MAVLKTHPFTGTVGATISAAAEGFSLASGTMTYAAGGIQGSTAGQVAAAATAYLEDTATTADWTAMYVQFPAIPTTGDTVFAIRLNGSTTIANIGLIATGVLRLFSSLGTTAATFTTPMVAGTTYRIEWQVTLTGQTAKLYTETGSTPLETKSGVVASSTLVANKHRFGHPQTAKAVGAVLFDQITLHDSEPLLGLSNVAPSANAGSDLTDISAWSTVTLDGSGTDSDGSVVSLVWTQTGGSPNVVLSGGGADPTTFVAPATTGGTVLTFTLTATDNNGATSTDTMTVTVLPVYERVVLGGVQVPIQIFSVST